MSSAILRKNHRIHPCDTTKKMDLLTHLVAQYPDKKILVISTTSLGKLELSKNITIIRDNDLDSSNKNRFDILISYDLPEKAITYMTRLAQAREMAFILLGNDDQKYLYGIETLLGRTIIQETIAGFEPSFGIEVEAQSKAEAKARRAIRQEEEALKKDKWAKKEKDKPKFLGKDANGKAIFDKKTRDRNHYIDGTPRTDDEKASFTQFKSKPVFFGEDKKSSPKRESKEFKEKKDSSDKKGFGEKKSFNSDKKPYGDKVNGAAREGALGQKKSFGDKKPYGDKKGFGDKKPFEGKKSFDKKPAAKAEAAPARPPKRIDVKSLKPKESGE